MGQLYGVYDVHYDTPALSMQSMDSDVDFGNETTSGYQTKYVHGFTTCVRISPLMPKYFY
jgi:hypothetical protein